MPKRKLPPDKEVIDLYLSGKKCAEIGRMFGMANGNNVAKLLKRNKIEKLKLDNNAVIKKYKEIKNAALVGKYFNVSSGPILKILKNNGFKLTNRRHFINEDYFKKIDSHEKAYFLGYIFADGCVRVRPDHGKSFFIGLHEKDISVLKRLSNRIGGKSLINKMKNSNCFRLNVYSNKFVDNLIKLGCVPRKSLILKYPKIDKKYDSSFILGYFDGDGCVCFSGYGTTAQYLGSKKFLMKIKKILLNNDIKSSRVFKTKTKIYCLVIYGRCNIIKCGKFMNSKYSGGLLRKKIIFKKIDTVYNASLKLDMKRKIKKEKNNIKILKMLKDGFRWKQIQVALNVSEDCVYQVSKSMNRKNNNGNK